MANKMAAAELGPTPRRECLPKGRVKTEIGTKRVPISDRIQTPNQDLDSFKDDCPSARKMYAMRECVLKHDIGREREVPDYIARLEIPLGIAEGPRDVSFQYLKFPHCLSEQEATEKAGHQRAYLFGPAHEASPALIPAVSHQTSPRADVAR